MIELRMVTNEHGHTQLQSRWFCVPRGYTEWKSIPIVYDPSQFVAGAWVFDAKTSGAKPDGGLTAAQVARILKKFEDKRDECDKAAIASNNERFKDSQSGMTDGISNCLLIIRSELSPQPDKSGVEDVKPVQTVVEEWVPATHKHLARVANGEFFKARFKKDASNPNWVCTDVDGYDLTLCGWDRGSFIDSAGEQWDLCQIKLDDISPY